MGDIDLSLTSPGFPVPPPSFASFFFSQYLIGRDGAVLKRYRPTTEPNKMEAAIVDALLVNAAGVGDGSGASGAGETDE